MGLLRIAPPTTWPVSLTEAKRQCRILPDDDTFDDELAELIDAATSHLDGKEGELGGVCLEPQQWELVLDCWSDVIEIPIGPVLSVDSISYLDADGFLQTLSGASYSADLASSSAYVVRNAEATWPVLLDAINAVRVRFTAGHRGTGSGDSYVSAVPAPLRRAILLLVGHWFVNHEAVVTGTIATELPMAVKSLIRRFERWRL